MATIQERLERLTDKKRGKGRLKPAAARGAIAKDKTTVYPTRDTAKNGGIASPLTEQAYTGSTYLSLTSSDGLFTFEYPASTVYVDGNGNSVTVIHL